MIPREWSPGVKWFGLRWPPKAWWTDGAWYFNHPVSHLLGGLLIAVPMLLAGFTGSQVLILSAIIAAAREETQVEQWSNNGGYPLYSAVGDTAFVVLGALLTIVVAVR